MGWVGSEGEMGEKGGRWDGYRYEIWKWRGMKGMVGCFEIGRVR